MCGGGYISVRKKDWEGEEEAHVTLFVVHQCLHVHVPDVGMVRKVIRQRAVMGSKKGEGQCMCCKLMQYGLCRPDRSGVCCLDNLGGLTHPSNCHAILANKTSASHLDKGMEFLLTNVDVPLPSSGFSQ
jgi:hypothetical protein